MPTRTFRMKNEAGDKVTSYIYIWWWGTTCEPARSDMRSLLAVDFALKFKFKRSFQSKRYGYIRISVNENRREACQCVINYSFFNIKILSESGWQMSKVFFVFFCDIIFISHRHLKACNKFKLNFSYLRWNIIKRKSVGE